MRGQAARRETHPRTEGVSHPSAGGPVSGGFRRAGAAPCGPGAPHGGGRAVSLHGPSPGGLAAPSVPTRGDHPQPELCPQLPSLLGAMRSARYSKAAPGDTDQEIRPQGPGPRSGHKPGTRGGAPVGDRRGAAALQAQPRQAASRGAPLGGRDPATPPLTGRRI